jgi:hypothetical protein
MPEAPGLAAAIGSLDECACRRASASPAHIDLLNRSSFAPARHRRRRGQTRLRRAPCYISEGAMHEPPQLAEVAGFQKEGAPRTFEELPLFSTQHIAAEEDHSLAEGRETMSKLGIEPLATATRSSRSPLTSSRIETLRLRDMDAEDLCVRAAVGRAARSHAGPVPA